MLALFIHFCEAAVIALSAVLVTRLFQLEAQAGKPVSAGVDDPVEKLVDHIVVDRRRDEDFHYENKMESLKLAQSFAGAQMMAVRKDFATLAGDDVAWLRQAISLYLIGAADFIGKQHQCAIRGRKELIRMVLRTQLKLSAETSQDYFNDAVHRQPLSDSDHMIRAGAKAARMWLRSQSVPEELALRNQLEEWGVFA